MPERHISVAARLGMLFSLFLGSLLFWYVLDDMGAFEEGKDPEKSATIHNVFNKGVYLEEYRMAVEKERFLVIPYRSAYVYITLQNGDIQKINVGNFYIKRGKKAKVYTVDGKFVGMRNKYTVVELPDQTYRDFTKEYTNKFKEVPKKWEDKKIE